MLNRAAVLLKYKKPAVNWIVSSVDPKDHHGSITEDEVNEERTVYLIDEDEEENIDVWISENYREIFENELSSWYSEEHQWPKPITLELFRQWFEVECHAIVIDMGTEDLEDDSELDEEFEE